MWLFPVYMVCFRRIDEGSVVTEDESNWVVLAGFFPCTGARQRNHNRHELTLAVSLGRGWALAAWVTASPWWSRTELLMTRGMAADALWGSDQKQIYSSVGQINYTDTPGEKQWFSSPSHVLERPAFQEHGGASDSNPMSAEDTPHQGKL